MFGRKRTEREMAQEMQQHIEARTEHLVRSGLTRGQAARQARLEFGATERYKEECRESRGFRLTDEFAADLRFAWRQMRKNPAFAAMAVALLAIGTGAGTAVFSTIDAVMLRTLPVRDPEHLRRIEWTARRTGFHSTYNGSSKQNAADESVGLSISYPVYKILRDRTSSFSGLMTFGGWGRFNLTIRGRAELAGGELVSGNYFAVLETGAIAGRVLTPEDDRPGSANVAVLSHAFWERMWGGDRGVLGQSIAVNGTPVTIVGVLPRGVCGVDPARCPDLFLPMALQPAIDGGVDALGRPDRWAFEVMGRLKEGIADEPARAETELLMRQAIEGYRPPDEYDPPRVTLLPGGAGIDRFRASVERPFQILSWAVGAVLLIACANLAGILLARATARQREIGTRLALGAGRGRLIRQLLTESLLLAVIGGVAGIGFAYLIGDGIARMFVEADRRLGVSVALNLKVLGFSIALCTLTGIAFGLAPAIRATRTDPLTALKAAAATVGRTRFRLGKALIVVQVALSLVLVAGAALFIRTLINMRSISLGFRPEQLLVFQLDPTLNGYRKQRLLDFHEQVLRRIAEIPGVRSATMSRSGLLSGGGWRAGVQYEGKDTGVDVHYAAPRFLETWGIPLIAGRDVSWDDRENSPRVVVINQALARKLFADRNPLGRIVGMGDRQLEIVGVAGNAKFESLREGAKPAVYIPFRQNSQHSMTYVVRSETEPATLVAAARSVVESVDRNVPMFAVKTQAEQIDETIRRERMFAYLLTGFAALAVALACLGIYGTLSYLAARRTPEIGLRLALGARPASVIGMVLRESLLPVVAGVALGVWAALSAGKMVEAMLYGLKPGDAPTLVAVGALLLGSALVAGWWPARRASRIAPMLALRHD